VDERNDLNASTSAACRHLASNFKEIRKKYNVSSWVLTAAAYNTGVGNIGKAIKSQDKKNYFEMSLNKETAEYVYKIIAVKELFEYPELYLKDFGYNVFNNKATSKLKNETDDIDKSGFDAINVKMDKNEDDNPESLATKGSKSKSQITPVKNSNVKKEGYVFAYITGNYNNFKDGSEIRITLEGLLSIENSIKSPLSTITGTGWKIDDKIYIDFGYGKKLIVIDFTNKKHDGIAETALKDKTEICLKVTEFYN
jgi:hypothetical protein